MMKPSGAHKTPGDLLFITHHSFHTLYASPHSCWTWDLRKKLALAGIRLRYYLFFIFLPRFCIIFLGHLYLPVRVFNNSGQLEMSTSCESWKNQDVRFFTVANKMMVPRWVMKRLCLSLQDTISVILLSSTHLNTFKNVLVQVIQ